MKRITLLLSAMLIALLGAMADGIESFETASLSGSYSDGSFTNNAITWTYVESRNESSYGIDVCGIILRSSDFISTIKSSDITGGITSFSCKLKKAYTSGGSRQVSLFINGDSIGVSDEITDAEVYVFTIEDINIEGDFTIEVKNATESQICIDDIEWISYDLAATPKPRIKDLTPASGSKVILGQPVVVSAIVTMSDNSELDSVKLFHGRSIDSLPLSVQCWQEVDTFRYNNLQLNGEGNFFVKLIAYAANGEQSETAISELVGVCSAVSIPEAMNASAVTASSFTANWADVSADKYLLSVWTEALSDTTLLINEGFDEGTTEPTYWDFHNVSTYTTAGSSGLDAPSLKFDNSKDSVTIALNGTATELSFWIKGNSAATSTFIIEGFNGEVWLTVDSIKGLGAEETKVYNSSSIPVLPDEMIKFKFSYKKVGGNACFDDVVIKGSGSIRTIIYQNQEVNSISYDIFGLTTGTVYQYSVVALNQWGCMSNVSNVIMETPKVSTNILNVRCKVGVYAVDGAVVLVADGATWTTVYDISGRQVAKKRVNGEVNIAVKTGIYLVKIDDTVTKVIVR